jgi:predicted RNase H-related nuclease YkuK (DUF458 family)
MYKKHIDVNEVAEFVTKCGPGTKLYIGCDSERLQANDTWYADYITAVVVHINGKNGCKIFGAVERERDYEQRVDKPRMRLMNEVYKVANLYLELAEVVDCEIEVHLDINPSEMHNSNLVINEAIGYIRGMCNVIPLVKPRAFAASYAADRYKEIVGHRAVA